MDKKIVIAHLASNVYLTSKYDSPRHWTPRNETPSLQRANKNFSRALRWYGTEFIRSKTKTAESLKFGVTLHRRRHVAFEPRTLWVTTLRTGNTILHEPDTRVMGEIATFTTQIVAADHTKLNKKKIKKKGGERCFHNSAPDTRDFWPGRAPASVSSRAADSTGFRTQSHICTNTRTDVCTRAKKKGKKK